MTPTVYGFAAGMRALLRGASTIARDARLWPFAIAPLVVASFAFALGLAGGFALEQRLVEPHLASLWGWAQVLARVVVGFVLVIVAAIVSKVVVLPIAAGPFNQLLSERVEQIVTGQVPPSVPFREALRDALPAARRGIATAIYGIGVLIICAPLLLVPVVGALLYVFPSAYVEALNALDVTFGRKRMDLAAKRTWLRERRSTAVGFGAAITLANLVPIVGALLVVPAAAAGGTLLVIGESKA